MGSVKLPNYTAFTSYSAVSRYVTHHFAASHSLSHNTPPFASARSSPGPRKPPNFRAMAQDGRHGHQDAAPSNRGSWKPPATVIYTLSSDKKSNDGESGTGVPVGSDGSKGKDVIANDVNGDERGSAHGSRTVAALSKGKRSAADVAAADAGNDGAAKGKSSAADGDAAGARSGSSGDGDGDRAHIITERERRKRMKTMFSNLHALLPHVPERSDKATVVGEAIGYIRALEDTVAKLEKRKRELALARQAAAAAKAAGAGVGSSSSAVEPHAAQAAAMCAWPPQPLPLPQQQQQSAASASTAAAPPPSAATTGSAGFQSWSGPNVVVSVSNNDAYISVCAPRRPGVLTLVLSVLEKYQIGVVTTQVASDGARSMFTIHGRVNPGAGNQPGEDPMTSDDIYKLAVSEVMVWLSS
ncbi:hypothetical protein ACP70R_027200 [Stipagrostis hirtigluma subsp. patula]